MGYVSLPEGKGIALHIIEDGMCHCLTTGMTEWRLRSSSISCVRWQKTMCPVSTYSYTTTKQNKSYLPQPNKTNHVNLSSQLHHFCVATQKKSKIWNLSNKKKHQESMDQQNRPFISSFDYWKPQGESIHSQLVILP